MWNKIFINATQIEKETYKATLVKMPNNSSYAGYKFWHPTKLIRNEGGKGYHLSLSFTDEFQFKLIKHGKGSYNKFEIISEKTISAQEMLEEFGVQTEAIGTSVKQEIENHDKTYVVVTEPKPLNVEVTVNAELKNN